MKLLEGRVAIVTGAAKGIGLAVAQRFFDEGAAVMMADADEETVLSEALELDPDRIRTAGFRCDPTQRLDINNLMAATLDAFDSVDILVNATTLAGIGDAIEVNEKDFDDTMSVNLKSAFLLTQLFAKYLVKRAEETESGKVRASVINVSALTGDSSRPDRFLLGVTMAGLDQLTRGFAVSLAPFGIRVNGIAPGGIAGRFSGMTDPGVRKDVIARTPMGRLAETTEVAGIAAMLASDNASYVTGQIMAVDGGRSIFEQPLVKVEE